MPVSSNENNPNPRLRLDRLAGLSDGVIAIAITILVLGLEVPSVHEVPEKELGHFVLDSLHPMIGFVLSFLLIGTYWLIHHAIFHYLTHATRIFVALNGFFLLSVSILPFPTGLQAVYRDDELAMMLYSIAHLLCGLSLLAMWLYATKSCRLIDPRTSQVAIQSMTQRLLIAPGLSFGALGISLFSITGSKLVFLTIPLFYISHVTVDSGWRDLRHDELD
jgi:uncharacterized membrane protein